MPQLKDFLETKIMVCHGEHRVGHSRMTNPTQWSYDNMVLVLAGEKERMPILRPIMWGWGLKASDCPIQYIEGIRLSTFKTKAKGTLMLRVDFSKVKLDDEKNIKLLEWLAREVALPPR
jgi:hypothetical protein